MTTKKTNTESDPGPTGRSIWKKEKLGLACSCPSEVAYKQMDASQASLFCPGLLPCDFAGRELGLRAASRLSPGQQQGGCFLPVCYIPLEAILEESRSGDYWNVFMACDFSLVKSVNARARMGDTRKEQGHPSIAGKSLLVQEKGVSQEVAPPPQSVLPRGSNLHRGIARKRLPGPSPSSTVGPETISLNSLP